MTTSGGTAEIDESFLCRSLVQGQIDFQGALGGGLELQRLVKRDNPLPLVDGAPGQADSTSYGDRRVVEVRKSGVLEHDTGKYSMLNLQVKDAVPTVAYAFSPMETMGERIRRLRVAKNYTQEHFGEMVGVSKSAVSQWEDDSTKNIKLATVLKVVDVLGTDLLYLIHGDSRAPGGGTSPSGRLRAARKSAGT